MAKPNSNPVVHLHVTIRRDQMDALVSHTKHGGHLNLSEATRDVLDQVFQPHNPAVQSATPQPATRNLQPEETA